MTDTIISDHEKRIQALEAKERARKEWFWAFVFGFPTGCLISWWWG